MKKLLLFLPLFLILGCNTPFGRFLSVTKKVDNTKEQITKIDSELHKQIVSYLFGADFSLSLDKNPNKYSQVAKEMTGRGLAIEKPSFEEINKLKEIVNNLTSTNENLIIKGQKQLQDKDNEVILLQNENTKLQEKLIIQEVKLREVNQENAQLATTWKRITRGFWWVVWLIGIGLLLSLLGKILPPPYNNIAYLCAIPFGLVSKGIHALWPQAKQIAGVVGKEYKEGLEQIVTSIEDTKEKIKERNMNNTPIASAGLEQLKTELNTNTDNSSKLLIQRTKEDLGY